MSKCFSICIVVVTIILWGSAFPAIRMALRFFSPTHLAAFRFLVASVALGCVYFSTRPKRIAWSDVPILILNGVVGVGFYNLFLNRGQLTVDAGAASLLVNTAPLWTMIWSVLFLKEKPLGTAWIGLLLSFAGVSLVALRHDAHFEFNIGALLVLGASVAHSVYIVLMKQNVARYGAIGATTIAVWCGTLFLLFFSRGLTEAVVQAPLPAVLIVIYLGLFPAALAYVLWSKVLTEFPASRAVSFLFFVPVAAFVMALFWLGEKPTWNTLAGGVLIIVGVSLVHRKS